MRALKHHPFPEITRNAERRGPWDIRELSGRAGFTNNDQHEMKVPLSGDKVSAAIRAHEMGHKEWSPRKVGVGGIDNEVLQVAEDARIHAKLKWLADSDTIEGFAHDKYLMTPSVYLDHSGEGINWRGLALTLVDYAPLEDTSRAIDDMVRELRTQYGDDPTQARHIEFAQNARAMANRVLTKYYTARRYRDGVERIPFAATKELGRELMRMFKHYEDELATPEPPPECEAMKDHAKSCDDEAFRSGRRNATDGEWAPMVTLYPPLSVTGATQAARRRRAKDYGIAMAHPHRLLVDGKVFGEMRKVKGGTVLVDVSGSMHFEPNEIEELIKAAPAIVVATYSGNSSHHSHAPTGIEGPHGVLSIVGKGGRRAGSGRSADGRFLIRPCGGQNIVDGPALRWLAKQKEPRYWVSDGMVTGIAKVGGKWQVDNMYSNLIRDAIRIVATGRIKRVGGIAELLEAIRTQGRKGVEHGLPMAD